MAPLACSKKSKYSMNSGSFRVCFEWRAGLRGGTLADFEPFEQVGQNVACIAALHGFALCRGKFEQLDQSAVGWLKRQGRLLRLQDVVNPCALFARALGKSHQVRGRKLPGGRSQHAGGGDIVVRGGDEPQVGEHVLDERMLEDREPRNHKGNLAAGKFEHEFVAVAMRAI